MSEQEFFRTRLLALLDFRFKKSLVLDMAAVCPISLDFGENDLESARFNPVPQYRTTVSVGSSGRQMLVFGFLPEPAATL
jgi:hypothetical protein